MTTIAIIGTGRVAWQLYKVFKPVEAICISMVLGRSAKALTAFTGVKTTTKLDTFIKADFVLIAVTDNAIAQVSEQINCSGAIVCHVSGSMPLSLLQNHQNSGVFYPLQTFGNQREVCFKNIPLLIEGSNAYSAKAVSALAKKISDRVSTLHSEQRKALHLAAVWVNNFSNFLYGEAQDFCLQAGLDFSLLDLLMKQTVENALAFGPKQAQTGPARRNDTQTITEHLNMLPQPLQKNLYKTISNAISERYTHEL